MSDETKEDFLDIDPEPTEVCATCDEQRVRSDMLYYKAEKRWFCKDGCSEMLGLTRCENCGIAYSAEFNYKCPHCGHKAIGSVDK